MRALIAVILLALAGCAATGNRGYQAAGSQGSTIADRMGSGANAKNSGNPVKSGSAVTDDLLARPGRL